MKEKQRRINIIKIAVLFSVALGLYIAVAVIMYGDMKESLFVERSEHARLLTEKMTQNVEMGMQARLDSLHHLERQYADMTFATMEDATTALDKMLGYRDEYLADLFFADVEGNCYCANGAVETWDNFTGFEDKKDIVFVSGENNVVTTETDVLSEEENVGIYFVTKLEQPFTVDGVRLEYLGLVCTMDFIDPFFATEELGEGSTAFIIKSNGVQIYRQKETNPLSGTSNLFTALSGVKYEYGMSYEKVKEEIIESRCGSASVVYQDENYFLLHHKMQTNDWTSVVLMSEKSVGTASKAFMTSIVVSMIFIFCGIMVIFSAMLFLGTQAANKRKDLINEQLKKAAEAERSANKAKTQFLSSMSHDIRTPMNAIIGMTMLAQRHLDDREYIKNCLEKVSLASQHLLTLINDVLDISKVESGKMTLNYMPFSVREMMRSISHIIQPEAEKKNQWLEITNHEIIAEFLYADELRLNQVFINLLTNAVKYTPEHGCVKADLWQEPVEGTKEKVRLVYVVEDTGIGMSEEFQKNMYRSFMRAEDIIESQTQGTGLGLTICKQMVELMEGTIDCESEVGKGTRFTVTLTVDVAKEQVKQTEGERRVNLSGMHILVAEDNDLNWEIAEEILGLYEITCERAENGQKCLELLDRAEDGRYDLVLMDVQMPVLGGYDTANAIRASEREYIRNLPVIAMTANAFADDIQQCIAAGMDGHIAKPINIDNLVTTLEKIRGGYRTEVKSHLQFK